jgi:hypothetical protein
VATSGELFAVEVLFRDLRVIRSKAIAGAALGALDGVHPGLKLRVFLEQSRLASFRWWDVVRECICSFHLAIG